MKVIVAHPGQQHSFKVASALKKDGILFKYMTAVYDKPDNLAMRLAHMLVKGKDITKIGGRKNSDLDDNDVVTFYTFLSLVVIILSRSSKTKKISYWLDRKIADFFGKKVAKYAVRNNVDAVICFSMNERTCFEYLKKHNPSIKRIVDCANSPVNYMRKIYEHDMATEELKKEVPGFWNNRELKKQQEGLVATQYFLAPSDFVKKGLVFCGVNTESIFVLPYGTNFKPVEKEQKIPEKVKFIYVGQVTYRKGMHYLLKAFSELESFGILIDIVGGWRSDTNLYEKYKKCKNIIFHGNIPHEKVKDLLLAANVFVFSSLTEGLSLSCLEAFSCGLPVICSTNAGANDLVVDGINGFVIRSDDVEQIKEKALYFVKHPDVIPMYSKSALETAKNNTWDSYRYGLKKIIHQIL